jgi:FkbM family methyltransferase
MNEKITALLVRHRTNRSLRKLDSALIKIHQAYENFDYDFHRNGEAALLENLRVIQSPMMIFDVGANKGLWSSIASKSFPQGTVHAFEIVPRTYAHLERTCADLQNVITHNIGLSDEKGSITVYYAPDKDGLATCVTGFSERFHKYQPQKLDAPVTTGDCFCSDIGVEGIDYLKIDVEGFEHKVLKGFEGMLRRGRIGVIQFEYGYVNIDTHFLLKDFYDYLGAFDMKIGKIFPSYVEFRDYRYSDENFYGPNYLAVHSANTNIITALSNP